MNSSDLLKMVGENQPELMAKTAQMVALLGRVEADFVGDVLTDFNTILDVTLEKTADYIPTAWKTGWGPYGKAAVGTVAAGLAASVATDLYDAAKRGLTKGRNFKRIMDANPGLKKEVDPKALRMAYNTLHRFAPDFTGDPLVGGALLKQVAELPQMSHKTVIELIGAGKNLRESKGKTFEGLSKLGPDTLLSERKEERMLVPGDEGKPPTTERKITYSRQGY